MTDENELTSNLQNSDDEVTATETGGGWYEITVPWSDEKEKVQGEDAAKERIAQIVAEGAPQTKPDDGTNVGDQADAEVKKPEAKAGQNMAKQARVPRKFSGKLSDKEKKAEGMPKMTTIQLEESDEIPPGGLFLGVNGIGYMLQAGEPVDVPDFLLEVLDHAEMSAPVTNPQTKQIVGYRNRLRYPYRRL